MVTFLFRSVLLVSVRMAPLLLVLVFIPLLQKIVRANTLLRIVKILLVGMLLLPILTYFRPLFRLQAPVQVPNLLLPPLELPIQELEEIAAIAESFPERSLSPEAALLAFPWRRVWLCGVIILAVYTILRILWLRRYVGYSRILTDSDVIERFSACCHTLDIKCCLSLRISADMKSPITVGWRHPTIMLPANGLPEDVEEQRLILTHELYHCKNRDNAWKVVSLFVVAIYWFYPLVWLLDYFLTAECELVCDEWVVKDAPGTVRKCYRDLLIKIAKEQQREERAMPLQSGIYATYGIMKLRVLQLSSKAPKSAGTVLLGIFILWLILFSGLIYFHQIDMPAPTFSSQQRSTILQSPDNMRENSDTYFVEENPMGYIVEHLPPSEVSKQSLPLPVIANNVICWQEDDEAGASFQNIIFCYTIESNKTVTASCDGTIVAGQSKDTEDLSEEEFAMRALGKYVVLDCGNGLSVRYTFLDSVAVEPGQHVSAGDVLGTAGHTGASYGDTDQCGVYVMQDGLMVDPLLFFDIDVPIQEIP